MLLLLGHGVFAPGAFLVNGKMLLEAALRLRRAIGDNDLAARVSGGKFSVLAQGLTGHHCGDSRS